MSEIRLQKISIKNYRSFGDEQIFEFPERDYKKPISIIGYNNSGKTNLMNAILYGIGEKFISTNSFEKTDLTRWRSYLLKLLGQKMSCSCHS